MGFSTRELRNTLGCFATGVTVVTTAAEGYAPLGITVNSFASVSLNPPMVLWSLDRGSDTFPAFAAARYYTVNILTETQLDLSNQFARANNQYLDKLSCKTGDNGCPILPDTLAFIECEINSRLDGGDHIILLGRVLRFEKKEGKPLIFSMGNYAKITNGL
ncbi:MAG: flavin reductase family protein [SAR324 cluster bacterium]|nr:flavin reductase family protein [SAR324 cluster bacterium]